MNKFTLIQESWLQFRWLDSLMARAVSGAKGYPSRHILMAGRKSFFQGSLPNLLWASHKPRISPGIAIDKPPEKNFFLYIHIYMCVCVCVCVHVYIYIYIYIYVCVCVCVCMCVLQLQI